MGPRVSSLLRQVLLATSNTLAAGGGTAVFGRPQRDPHGQTDAGSRRPVCSPCAGLPVRLETLLAYVPFAENDSLSAQLFDLLASIGCSDGKGDPAPYPRAGLRLARCSRRRRGLVQGQGR